MSQKETTGLVDRMEFDESPTAHLSRLSEQAREAFERKDKKECLDLTRSILLIDPHHVDAHTMRVAIQSEMQRDLDDARSFLRQAQSRDSNMENPEQPKIPVAGEDAVLVIPAHSQPSIIRWLALAFLLAVAGASVLFLTRFKTASSPGPAAPVASTPSVADKAPEVVAETPAEPEAPAAAPEKMKPVAAKEIKSTPLPASTLAPASEPAQTPAIRAGETLTEVPAAAAAAAPGKLAISSPTSVDIYRNDVLLGSVPISLELPAGAQTLEYRHGNLRRSVTHNIVSNETTKATITFDITVQINAKPWAEVFIDGSSRRDLGQTPLSGVRVPIGSILSFENPQFPARKYRVTGNETGIQIVLP